MNIDYFLSNQNNPNNDSDLLQQLLLYLLIDSAL